MSAGAAGGFEMDDDNDDADSGMVTERCGAAVESLLDADREGPSKAATCADRVTKDLYWYLASRIRILTTERGGSAPEDGCTHIG